MTNEDTPIPGPLNNVIRIDDERIKGHLDRVVRGTVEETLNALLDAEADRLCNAQRYERSEARRDTRAGHYERKLQTKAGEVKLRIPKLRMQTFETAIIDRYRRRESSVEEALIEMYLAGVSVRRGEDITEALWTSVQEFCELAFAHVGLEGRNYVHVEFRYLRPRKSMSLLAIPQRHSRNSNGEH